MNDRSPLSPTTVRRWTPPSGATATGTGEVALSVPRAQVERLRLLGPLPDVVLAAHLTVLGAVAAERGVLTGVVPPGAADDVPEPRGVWLDAGSRRDLVGRVREPVEVVDDPGPFDTVLDLSALERPGGEAVEAVDAREAVDIDEVVRVAVVPSADGGLLLRLRHRADRIETEQAARLAGYHRTALDLAASDPDGEHDGRTLVGEDEQRDQIAAFAGPDVPDDGRLFVELFEERARRCPDEPAASHRDRTWTYRELNARANRVAHTLLADGMRPEEPVAVVSERSLDWIAAMLGVLKAGAVYLPVRPDFPVERVGGQLARAGCRVVLSSATGAETAERALAVAGEHGTLRLLEDVLAEGRPDSDPGVAIKPDRLAYIYFTSGSTGAPKGAMCEHAGMLNHLHMKIDDLGLRAGDVVTQTASQCFDISLWQVVAPLLVGGSTRIVDTDAQLDVGRFVDELAAGGVHVIQIVPAYLQVLVAHLSRQPRALGDLRVVSVTGEALKLEVVRGWFALQPDIALVNAYGATEVSDDTMHEVLTGVPERGMVTVGRSLRNVRTYVLDSRLRLAPTGAPGEIAFAGVSVGRGYVNDPERTAQAFVEDPYVPGERMYRTGDFGRWLPEGKIEFLGRRDEQVKIRGFRIEIGDIENKLRRMTGVREAAVVVDDGPDDGTRTLVGFYGGDADVGTETVREHLATQLPEYMIPTYLHRLDALPLTENGKTDKKLLATLAGALGHADDALVAPVTDTERRLATAWAEVLGVPLERIGRRDNFFSLGGTSLAAVRMVIAVDREVSLAQLVENPVLEDLAACAGAPEQADEPPIQVQRLTVGDVEEVATLVCLPYAGGNAINFRQLANAMAERRIAVHAAEFRDRDLAGERSGGPPGDVAEVARAVQAALGRIDGPVLLWGHCAGAAFALEVARLMERSGRPPAGVFVGALLLGDVDALRAESDRVAAMSDDEVVALLRDDSAFVELDALQPERIGLVGDAYRHDVCSTNRYLIDAQDPRSAIRVATPLHVVIAPDDPTTAGFRQRADGWRAVADDVVLHELDGGGHYFVRTRADDVADLVASAVPVQEALR